MARGKGTSGRKRTGGRSAASGKRSGRWSRWLWMAVGVIVIGLLAALPVYRWWWHRGERSELGRGVELLAEQGCESCHRDTAGCWKWRADGGGPASTDAIRDAVLNGRPVADGFPAAMPPFADRLVAGEWRRIVVAVGSLVGILGVPEDQELAAGRDIVMQMGCRACHGVLGGGGVPNPGSLSGEVPGWYGRSFSSVAAGEGSLEALLRDGARQHGNLFPGEAPPLLVMPAYGGRLDSVELDLLARYLEWLHENPPALGAR